MNTSTPTCDICGSDTKYYDTVKRFVWLGNGRKDKIYIRRYRCLSCNHLQRSYDPRVVKYKRYHREVIVGFVCGYLSTTDLEYELFPCDITVERWIRDFCKPPYDK